MSYLLTTLSASLRPRNFSGVSPRWTWFSPPIPASISWTILTEIEVLVVVDSIQTGNVPPGTLYVLRSSDMKSVSGPSPHYVGLLETLQLARELLLNVPKEVIILAVEAADCLTLGGAMHDAVKSAVGLVADLVAEIAQGGKPAGTTTTKIPGTV